MRIAVLSSGSRGNSTFIETPSGSILIDAGLSGKAVLERMDSVGADHRTIMAVIITHDHADHINGAGIIARKLKIPVYIHRENYLTSAHKFEKCEINFIEDDFKVGDILISPYSVSHDGTANFAYNIVYGGKKITHLTDLGKATTLVKQRIKGTDLFVLESNHDPKMLKEGPYPWYLKQRISGNKGHLSNEDAVNLIIEMENMSVRNLVLAHLSEENNDPSLALDYMTEAKEKSGFGFQIHVASQNKALEFIEV